MDPTSSAPDSPDVGPSSDKAWRVGTLSYTSRGLAVLFCWLLCGDFAWSLRDRVIPAVMPLLFQKFGASDALTGFLIASLPSALGLVIGPVVGYNSDRLRTRWGRRIPFLLLSTPFIIVSIAGLAFCVQWGGMLHHALASFSPGPLVSVLIFAGASWAVFEISVITAASVFGGLVNDVVPQKVLGRYFGLFRAVGLLAGILFNYWLFGEAKAHFTWIFLAVGAAYGIGFPLMCLKVKEGKYPPPPHPSASERKSAFGAVRAYFRDGFGHPYYLWFFAATILASLASVPFNLYSLFYSESLSMSNDAFGKCLALTYVCSLVLAYPLGSLADRFHPLRLTIVVLVFYAASMAYGVLFTHDRTTFAIALIVHGVLSGTQFTVTASLAQRLLPRAKFTEIGSAGGILSSVTGIVVAPSLGLLLDYMHHQYRYTFLAGLVFSLLGLGACVVLHQKFMALGGPKHYVAPE